MGNLLRHRILERLLSRGGKDGSIFATSPEQWAEFLDGVNGALEDFDRHRIALDRALGASSREMNEVRRSQAELLDAIGHEVRNPLSLIMATVEAGKMAGPEVAQKDAFESISVLCQELIHRMEWLHPSLEATPSATVESASDGMEQDEDLINQEVDLLLDSRKSTVLVVDGHREFRMHMRSVLGPFFNVFTAADSASAISLVSSSRVDAILSEYELKDGTGLELMKKLRLDPKLTLIPFVVLTTQAQESAKVEALEAGAEDFFIKPFSERELRAKLSTIITARKQQLKLIKELQIAGKMQRSLLPPMVQNFGDVQLSALFFPSEDLSGDFFDSRQSGQWVYCYLADVMGHGFLAAQVTLLLKELFHGALDHDPEMGLVELLKWIADKYSTYQLDRDLAIQVVRYHLKERRIEYVRANSPAAIKIQTDGLIVPTNVKAGPAISTGNSHFFDPNCFHVFVEALKPGESLYLFTDGAYELNAMERIFGRRQLIEILTYAPAESWQQFIVDALSEANGSKHFSDDITVIRLDVLEFHKAMIVVQEMRVAKDIRLGLEAKYPGFKVSLAMDVEEAVEILENSPYDAVIVQGTALEALPVVRKFATILISSIPQLSIEKALAGKVDLVFSEQLDFADLFEAVRNPSVQRENQWRRLLDRVEVKVRLNVELSEVGEIRKGDVINIGLGGMFVGVTFPMPAVGEKISFRLTFGDTGEREAVIEGIGVIRWTRANPSESLPVGCGVQFVTLTESSIENLRRVLHVSKATELIPLC